MTDPTLPLPTEPSGEARIVTINRESVELFKILKFEGLQPSGGEAKLAIAAGLVQVNGHIETRKRRKIVSGDTIVFAAETLIVSASGNGQAPADEQP